MNLIFNFDGTAAEPRDAEKNKNIKNESISNILKIHLLAGGDIENKKQSIKTQQSFYYPGVGTRGNFFTQIWQSAFASKAPVVILGEAFLDLKKYYTAKDNIYIIGFSRGAAIARIFASKLSKLNIPVEFLGVFDTVAAFGFPNLDQGSRPISDVLFEDNSIGENIKQVYHLVSMDENRLAFRPTLMNTANNIEEVWFPGVHTDIGGGYYAHGLSDCTLDYFLDVTKKNGLNFYNEYAQIPSANLAGKDHNGLCVTIGHDDLVFDPDEVSEIHYHNEGWRNILGTLAPREGVVLKNNVPCSERIKVHISAINRKRFMDYDSCILDGQNFIVVM